MIKSFLYCFISAAIFTLLVALLTKSTWSAYFDKNPPVAVLVSADSRIGVGSAGGRFGVDVSDEAPGIDEVVVRLRQLRSDRELFRKKLHGAKNARLEIEIPGQQGNIGEGAGEIEIVAFDRSFYSNRGSTLAKAFVDTRAPHIEVISAQHNLRQGGSQLVIYSAKDENLAFSGVRVGNSFFKGYPAAQLDSSLNKDGLYAALYTVPLDFSSQGKPPKPVDIKLRVVDIGGNAVEQPFYNRTAKRTPRVSNLTNSRLLSWLSAFPQTADSKPDSLGDAVPSKLEGQGVQDFAMGDKISGRKQADVDAATLVKALDRVSGTAVLAYGEKINQPQNAGLQTGSVYIFTGISDARALHAGEVSLVRDLGDSTFEVKIDHGLGLSTVYKGLKSAVVREGGQVKSGEVLGSAGAFLAVAASVSGTPVDLTEWWSQDWVSAHIFDKIQEVKKTLGIAVE